MALVSSSLFPLIFCRFHSLFKSMLAIVCPTRHFATLELILPFIDVFKQASCTSSDSTICGGTTKLASYPFHYFRSTLTVLRITNTISKTFTLQLAQMISSLQKKKSVCFDESTGKMAERNKCRLGNPIRLCMF